jgi:hypothetical protein
MVTVRGRRRHLGRRAATLATLGALLAGSGLAPAEADAGSRPAALRAAPQRTATPSAPGKLPYPLPAPAVEPPPCRRLPPGPPPPPLPPPAVAEHAVPIVATPRSRHVALGAIAGKGIWITTFPGQQVDAAGVVAIARHAGLQELYVRTGSSSDGFYGGQLLHQLVPLAHRYGVEVIAWDFPTLSDPAADAARAARAFAAGADGFSPDIEEAPEGTYLTLRRVDYYLSLVRAAAGSRPVIATVPRPTSLDLSGYPYAAESPFVDAFAPMVYWSCTEPGEAVAVAIDALRRLRPVAPIGQDYDMGSEGGPAGLPSGSEVWRFVDVARRDGAIGVSLYDLESGGRAQLAALAEYPWTHVRPRP